MKNPTKKCTIQIRLTENIYNQLLIKASELDLTVSEYVRAILLRYL